MTASSPLSSLTTSDSDNDGAPSHNERDISAALVDLPVRMQLDTRSSHHTTPEQPSQDSETRRIQDHLMRVLKSELGGATFTSNSFIFHLCPQLSGGWVMRIYDTLQRNGALVVKEGIVTIKDWPSRENSEKRFNAPLVSFLNVITDTFVELYPMKMSHYRNQDLRFCEYDRPMAEFAEGEHPIKPSIVLIRRTLLTDQSVSWYDAEIVGEVGSDWSKILQQATVYARCLFAASYHRCFIPILALNHTTLEFSLCVFHHGGLLSTPPSDITTVEGFQTLLSAIVGMWSWKNATEAGYISSHTNNQFSFNKKIYYIHHVLCSRHMVRGRATKVFLLGDEEGKGSEEPYSLSKNPKYTWELLHPWTRPPSAPTTTVEIGELLPPSVVIKTAFSRRDRMTEAAVFTSVRGFMGIVEVIKTWELDYMKLPEDVQHWDIMSTSTHRSVVDERVYRCSLMKTSGRGLHTAKGPRELGQAILQSIIGHCALFTEAKPHSILHCDISDGNIILIDKPFQGKVPELLQDIVLDRHCIAVICDGDVAKTWGHTEEPPSHRCGTMPFISRRVTRLWIREEGVLHTPIDDLESHSWVMLLMILRRIAKYAPERWNEVRWWRGLNSDDLDILSTKKIDIMQAFQDEKRIRWDISSKLLKTFQPLLSSWFTSAIFYAGELEDIMHTEYPSADERYEAIRILSEAAYKRYVEEGVAHVSRLPEDWPSED